MTLNIDTTASLQRPADLVSLVEAVLAATDEDEQDWLEWKNGLDLTEKATHFSIARVILGFANRDPAKAAARVHGHGYLVVGASPESLCDLAKIDPAALDDHLARYLGPSHVGPNYSAHWVSLRHSSVLVIIVDPPPWGAPGFPLRRTFQPDGPKENAGAQDGTIFVRSGTKTRPATSADHDMLHRRASASTHSEPTGPSLRIVAKDAGAVVVDQAAVNRLLSEKADEIAREMLREGSARKEELEAPTTQNLAYRLAIISDLGAKPRLTWEEYVQEVNDWSEAATEAAWLELLSGLTEAEHGRVALEVTNESHTNLDAVEVVVTFPPELAVVVFDEAGASAPKHPDPPASYDPRPRSSLELFSVRDLDIASLAVPRYGPMTLNQREGVYVDHRDDGAVEVTYVVGNLRPRQVLVTEPCHALLTKPRSEEPVEVTWAATSTGVDGVRTGTLLVPIAGTIDPEAAAAAVEPRM